MEVSKKYLEGVMLAGQENSMSSSHYDRLLSLVFSTVLSTTATTTMEKFSGISPVIIKRAHAGLVTLVLEAARTDAEDATLTALLDDCQYSPERISLFLQTYHHHSSEIQRDLSSNGRYPPHVVNVDWRQDYVIKSNCVEKENQLQYLVRLHTESSGQTTSSTVNFSCTVEELQDLVSKLKEATKCLERNAQT